MEKEPKIVVIGGGSGISVVLRGLKYLPIDLTAIVTVADDGGSSGFLRKEFDMPAPGDLRNVMVALSNVEPLTEEVFQYRFKEDSFIGGHPLGNLLIIAMKELTGDIKTAVDRLRKLFNIKGKILPATTEKVILMAEKENGKIVEGESHIPVIGEKIKRVYYKNEVEAPEENLKALEEADLIIYVVDASRNLDENDEKIFDLIYDKRTVILLNKSDLDTVVTEEMIRERISQKGVQKQIPVIAISAKEEQGIKELENTVKAMFLKGDLSFNEEVYITNARQKNALVNARESMKKVIFSIDAGMPEDFYSIDLMDAYESLGNITGESIGEDLVNEIFSKFCMGK